MALISMSTALATAWPDEDGAEYGPYLLCGWRVFSALPLPELALWGEESCHGYDAEVLRLTLDAEWLPGAEDAFAYRVEPTGDFLLQLPGLGRFRVAADGSGVTLAPVAHADPQLLRAHFYGSVVAVVCYLRGLLPLHGSCVKVGDRAILFTGPSGAGKSTLAAAFVRAGYALLCDDVCAIDLYRKQGAQVLPAFPRVKLLPDAIAAFSLDENTLYTSAIRGEKGHFLSQGELRAGQAAFPIAAIYLLGEDNAGIRLVPLHGAAAFLPLRTQVHRSNMGAVLGLRDRIFRDVSALVQRVPVRELRRPMDLRRIDEVVRRVVQREEEEQSL